MFIYNAQERRIKYENKLNYVKKQEVRQCT